jgi:Alanine dehydrogenase/PNT, C-terminal domain
MFASRKYRPTGGRWATLNSWSEQKLEPSARELRPASILEKEWNGFLTALITPFHLGTTMLGKSRQWEARLEVTVRARGVFTCMPHLSEFIVAEQAAAESGGPTSPNIPKSYDQIAPVPENVSSEHAVFTHLLLLGFNALQRGQYQFGENVVVIGLGVVGLGAACMARAAGARVAAIGNAPSRLETARAIVDPRFQTRQ